MTTMAPAHLGASQVAQTIPALGHSEAQAMATVEVARLVALLETLHGDDWTQPTHCTAWDVRAMVAHLAGACAAFTNWAEFRRQMVNNPYLKTEAMQVDGINRRQVEDRSQRTPAELVAEFRTVAPQAIQTRARLPWLLRKLPVPFGPPLGTVPVAYLTDLIYPRDQWMHRYDISVATGKPMQLTPEHDGRMVALVVRDLPRYFTGTSLPVVELLLTGPAGGAYRLGTGRPTSEIKMDACVFCMRVSGRIDAEQALAAADVSDLATARQFFAQAQVPF
jgi:uncharacterized protein (TIGR03083 family)